MTTSLRASGAAKAAALDALLNLVDTGGGGFLDIYDGVAPAGPDVAVSSQTKGARFTLSATAWASAVAGTNAATKSANAVASTTGLANITPTWGRFVRHDGTAIADADAGVSGALIVLSASTIVSGQTISFTSATISM
jgi:hypothetical protein